MGNQALRHNDDALSPQIRALLELEHFLSSPKSVGLDSVKESLRNVVQLMLELKGYSTGYDLSHLVIGEHSSLSMDGVLKSDALKKKKAKQLWDDYLELEREMANNFKPIFEKLYTFVSDIEDKIDDQLSEIDAKIEAIADNEEHAEQLKQSSKKRKRLKRFKKHVKIHKEEIKEAESTEELIDLKQEIAEDLKDFNNGKPINSTPTPLTAMTVISGFRDTVIHNRSKISPIQRDPFYDFADNIKFEGYQNHRQNRDDSSDDSDSSGKKEDIDPPSVPDL